MWLVVVVLILVAFLGLMSSLYALAVTGVPVVRTPAAYLREIEGVANIRRGHKVVDAGCGDARTLLALCSSDGIVGRGYELNGPVWLVAWIRVLLARKKGRVRVFWGDFFRCELEDVDLVFCHLMPGLMRRVAEKCSEEMKPGSRLMSYLWKVPDWEPAQTLLFGARSDPLYVYEIRPPDEGGSARSNPGQKLDGPLT